MAKIVIEFDTNDKTTAVTVDGVAVDNVVSAFVSKHYDYDDEDRGFECSVSTLTEDKANKTRLLTRLVAAESEAAKAAGSVSQAAAVPGLVAVEVTHLAKKVFADILNYMKKRA